MSSSILRVLVFVLLFGGFGPAFAAAPTATTSSATSITSSSALLNGVGNPNGLSTTGWFRYSTTNPGTCNNSFGSRVPSSGGTALGSGTSAVPYSINTTGLSPGNIYYFCAIVSNSSGTAFGAVQSFTIPAPPTVVTTGSISVTSTSATLQGSANPSYAATSGWFRFSTSNPGTCNSSFGSTSSSTSLGSGATSVPYSISVSGLAPATTYYYCALASNALGTSYGALLSLTTPAAAPRVSTSSATSVTGSGAVLNGAGISGGASTTGWFRYATSSPGSCNDSFGSRAPSSGGSALGSGTTAVAFSQSISGLSPATTYYFCAIASSSAGTAFGSVYSFVTPSRPTVTTTAASGITSSSATLSGYADPNYGATTGWFRYSTSNPSSCDDTFGSRAPVSGGSSLGSGGSNVSYAQSISGLSSGTTYYFCAIASSSEGTAFGAVMSFTTAGGPSVTTLAATSIASSSASLNGSANPNGGSSYGWFRYSTTSPGSCNDSFGSRAPSSNISLGSGSSATPFSASAYGLSPNTTYFFCAISNNSYGTSFGSLMSFSTPAAIPGVTTSSPTSITGTAAVLSGAANPGGASASGWFRYATSSPGSCNDSFGSRAPTSGGSSLGSASSTVAFTQSISGLSPNTTYYFCAIASNSAGTGLGSVLSFITPSPPTVTTTAASSISGTSASLNGSANPNRASTTGWFRYSTSNPSSCNDTFGSRAPVSGGSSLGSGSSSTTYAQSISGLSPATTYYYCAIASSSEGTAFGAVLSFATATAPKVTTLAATSVAATSANLNGSANPSGASTTGWFRYGTTNPGSCSGSFGYPSGSSSLGAGAASVAYSQSVGGLLPNTTYYFCAIANNTYGTDYGSVMSFTTPAATPTVSTYGPTSIGSTTAVLSGAANPGGASTTGWFRYNTTSPGSCNDSFGTRAPTSGGSSLGSGTSSVAYTQSISGLSPNTTYYYCAIASSSAGTGFGGIYSFITPSAPTVTTATASNIAGPSATLNGIATPNRAAATGWFRYGTSSPGSCNDTFGTRAPASGGTSIGSGTSSTSYSQAISGLTAATTYYFCAIASNAEGTGFGAVLSFTTPTAPKVTTVSATSIAATSATLNGSANPGGASTNGWFRYGATNPGSCSSSFGSASGASSLGSGTADVAYSRSIAGLLPNTTYYYCAVANNVSGSAYGTLLSFTTSSSLPVVSTDTATSVTTTAATLSGSATPNGAATTGWFRYATTHPGTCNDSFGSRAPSSGGTSLGAGNTSVAYSQALSGLSPGTTYYYCALAANSVGSAFGAVRSFTTQAPPAVTTLAATPVTANSATLNGSANPKGYATTGWFRYSTTSPSSCNDSFGTRVPSSSGVSLGSVNYAVGYSQSLSGLSASTTYYFCAIASSSIGTSLGSVLSFTTPASGTSAPTPPPASLAPAVRVAAISVTTLAAAAITPGSAVLSGRATSSSSESEGWFRYSATDPGSCSDTFGTRAPDGYGAALGSGSSPAIFAHAVTELEPGKTYYYCAVVYSPQEMSFGAVLSFVAGAEETRFTTQAATDVRPTEADPTVAASGPEETPVTGCAYLASAPHGSPLPPLLTLLPLASLLLIRRRRAARATSGRRRHAA